MLRADPVLLTSSRNPLVKEVRRAASRGTLTEQGFAVAESLHLLEEALRSECEVSCVLVASSARTRVVDHVSESRCPRVLVLDDKLFADLSSTDNSQGVLALVRPPAWTLDQLFRGQPLVVILDGIQDPGNAGAIVRAAEAFGATGCLFLKGSVSPFNPKSLRAAAGSLFRLPTVAGLDDQMARAVLEQHQLDLYAAMPDGKKSLRDVDLTRRFALVLGSEGRGVSENLRSGSLALRVPVAGVESLNVAVAAGVILYEAHRQRVLQ